MRGKLGVLRMPMPWHKARFIKGNDELVIFLHGLWRSHWAMDPLARRVAADGYSTLNLAYPSFKENLVEMVARVAAVVEQEQAKYSKVHFVTHSLGGVVVRNYLNNHAHGKCGRIVMLAPPLHGSRIVDWLQGSVLRGVLGPAGRFLSTRSMAAETEKVPSDVEAAVIMGNKVRIPLLHHLIQSESDGIIRVESGRVPGLKCFRVIEADHTLITLAPEVQDGVCQFLKCGKM